MHSITTSRPRGLLHFVLVFLPLRWGWVGFSFYVSRFPREDNIVRLLTLAAMLAVAALSTNVEGAFNGETAVGFALSYAGLRACLVALYVHTRWREPAARELVDFYIAGFGLGVVLWLVSAGYPSRPATPCGPQGSWLRLRLPLSPAGA